MDYMKTLEEYTTRRLARTQFAVDHADVLNQLATLDKELVDFEGLLKDEARQSGQNAENDHFLVLVQHKSRRVYDPKRIWANSDEKVRTLLVDQGAVEVKKDRLDELVGASVVSPAILEGAISEEPLTTAVTIKEKKNDTN